jgi:hypothetical protein
VEVENQEDQGPLWAVVPLMMMILYLIKMCDVIFGRGPRYQKCEKTRL